MSLYMYNGSNHTAEKIYSIEKKHVYKKEFRDSIDQWILSEILRRGGMPRVAKKIAKIALDHQMALGRTGYSNEDEHKQMKARQHYSKRLDKFDDVVDLHNATSLLERLLSETIGYGNIPREEEAEDYSGHRLIDYGRLSEEQYRAIAQNFKRLLEGKELIQLKEKEEEKSL